MCDFESELTEIWNRSFEQQKRNNERIVDSGPKGYFMFKSLINLKKNLPKFNLAKNSLESLWLCSQTPGKVWEKFVGGKLFYNVSKF